MGSKRNKMAITAAFAVIYLVWGSTYLAIRIGLETVPPFFLSGSRFIIAGIVLYTMLRLAGVPRPTDKQWWWSALTGILMLVFGVGCVTWGEQLVESGPACLLITTVPMWMTLFDTLVIRRTRPARRVVVGLGLGLAGVTLLIGPGVGQLSGLDPLGAGVILVAALSWSIGSLLSRGADLPRSPIMLVAIQMLVAGGVLTVVSGLAGEWQRIELASLSSRSVLAVAYLCVMGSMVGYSCYLWLLRQVPAPAVATYAFVNPLVAVWLGWALGGETMSSRLVTSMAMIVMGVVVIQSKTWSSLFSGLPTAEVVRVDRCGAEQCAGAELPVVGRREVA